MAATIRSAAADRTRLIQIIKARSYMSGVEIKLAAGYKTYWRTPGDSGVPPRFDWSGSENLASAEVSWPAPERFSDGSGTSVGYAKDVIFPLHVTPTDPSKPVLLKLALDYAVCEKLCIPAHATAHLTLGAEQTRHSARLAMAQAKVPLRIAMGLPAQLEKGAGPAPPALISAVVTTNGTRPLLHFKIQAPPNTSIIDVLVEGPEMWLFGTSRVTQAGHGQWQAETLLEEQPKTLAGPKPLLITIISNGQPIEIALDLDMPAATP